MRRGGVFIVFALTAMLSAPVWTALMWTMDTTPEATSPTRRFTGIRPSVTDLESDPLAALTNASTCNDSVVECFDQSVRRWIPAILSSNSSHSGMCKPQELSHVMSIPMARRQFSFNLPTVSVERVDFEQARAQRETQNCSILGSGRFIVTLCLSNNGCEGQLVMRPRGLPRTQEAVLAMLRKRVRSDAMLQRVCRSALGPESFRVRFVSESEVISHFPLYDKEHDEYVFFFSAVQFQLLGLNTAAHQILVIDKNVTYSLSTQFFLEVELLYEEYRAVDEHSSQHIQIVHEYPIQPLNESKGKHGEIIEAQHHSPVFNLFHFNEAHSLQRRGRFRASKWFTWDEFTYRSAASFSCNPNMVKRDVAKEPRVKLLVPYGRAELGADLDGRWIGVANDGRLRRHGIGAASHHTHFERVTPDTVYHFVQFSHALRSFAVGDVSAVLSCLPRQHLNDHRIAFLGDSQLRVMAVHLKNFLAAPCAAQEDHGVKVMSGKKFRFTSVSSKRSLSLEYFNDVLLTRGDLPLNAVTADVLVAGMGSWALGGQGPGAEKLPFKVEPDFGRWALSRYEVAVSGFVRRLLGKWDQLVDTMSSPSFHLVWISITAYPHNDRRFAKLKGEYRTNPRIAVFNTAAEEVIRRTFSEWTTNSTAAPSGLAKSRYRVSFVNAFSPTYPMMHLSLDHNHFVTYPQDAVLHILLNAICS